VILANYRNIKARAHASAPVNAINIAPVGAWLVGIATYYVAKLSYPDFGSALPSLIMSFVLAKIFSALSDKE